jgi:hypothetical protein
MKTIITILILTMAIKCLGQPKPFVGVSLHSIGYSLQGGVNINNKLLTIGYSVPLRSALNPSLVFATIGYEFNLSKTDKDIFAITTATGYSFYNSIKKLAPIATVEVSKDFYKGRIFATGNYCKVFFAGAGFKIFLN